MSNKNSTSQAAYRGCARFHMQQALDESSNLGATQLAEIAAIHLTHDEWLDDPDHWIWDLALHVHESYIPFRESF